MSKAGKIAKEFFLLILPIATVLHYILYTHTTWVLKCCGVSDEYFTPTGYGFPFLSEGYFGGNSGDFWFNIPNLIINIFILIIIAFAIYILVRKRIEFHKKIIWIFFSILCFLSYIYLQ